MRLVSLCPSVTELICDLGCARDLVGATRYCSHPPEALAEVEKIGGTKDPNNERIVELRPDLVFMNEEENRREDFEALTAAGLRCVSDLPKTVAETAAMVRRAGTLLDRSDEAEAIAREIEAEAEEARRAASRRGSVVTWAYLIWRNPWMVAGSDTFVDALLQEAGGRNVFGAKSERYPAITPEDLVAAAPQIVLLATEPFPFEEKYCEELATATGWSLERFRIVDGQDLSWHGSRTPRGIRYAAEVIESAAAL